MFITTTESPGGAEEGAPRSSDSSPVTEQLSLVCHCAQGPFPAAPAAPASGGPKRVGLQLCSSWSLRRLPLHGPSVTHESVLGAGERVSYPPALGAPGSPVFRATGRRHAPPSGALCPSKVRTLATLLRASGHSLARSFVRASAVGTSMAGFPSAPCTAGAPTPWGLPGWAVLSLH